MSAGPFALLYQPPCGQWYVHSHKMYPTIDAADAAAEKFLHTETPRVVVPITFPGSPAPSGQEVAEDDGPTARDDAAVYGIGFEVDGKRVHPGRVVMRQRAPAPSCAPATTPPASGVTVPEGGHANTEADAIAMFDHLNCPACGGSGHVDDVKPAALSTPSATPGALDPATVERLPDRDDIARVLFDQRQTQHDFDDAEDADPESDAGTLRSICFDDADAVLALAIDPHQHGGKGA